LFKGERNHWCQLNAKLLLVPNADHNDVSYIGDKNYDAAVQGFVAENAKLMKKK